MEDQYEETVEWFKEIGNDRSLFIKEVLEWYKQDMIGAFCGKEQDRMFKLRIRTINKAIRMLNQ